MGTIENFVRAEAMGQEPPKVEQEATEVEAYDGNWFESFDDEQLPVTREMLSPPPSSRKEVKGPTEFLHLPSLGIPYGSRLPGGMIEITPITVQTEKSLLGGGKQLTHIIDTMMAKCVVTDVVPMDEYLITDRFYIMFMLRAHSYGHGYKFRHRCQDCGQSSHRKVHIPKDFRIKYLDPENTEPWDVTLPVCGTTVSYRMLRHKDEVEIARLVKQQERNSQVVSGDDPTYDQSLARRIITVNGEQIGMREKLEFVNALVGKDSYILRDHFDKTDCGLDTEIEMECPKCGSDYSEVLPITADFFRATGDE